MYSCGYCTTHDPADGRALPTSRHCRASSLASVDLNHSTFAEGPRRFWRRRVTAPTHCRLMGSFSWFSSVEIVSSRLSRRARSCRATKIHAGTLDARSSSYSMLVSRLQTSFRSSVTSAVNCVFVRETGFDVSNWEMGFIDCLSLARPLSAQPRPSNCRAIAFRLARPTGHAISSMFSSYRE